MHSDAPILLRKISRVRKTWAVLVGLLAALAVCAILYYNLLPARYQWPLVGLVLVFGGLSVVALLRARRRKVSVFFAYLLTLVTIGAIAAGTYALVQGRSLFDTIANNGGQTLDFSVVVLKDSPITSVEQLKGSSISGASVDRTYVTKVRSAVQSKQPDIVASYPELVKRLYDGDTPAIVLNESYRDLFEDVYPKFGEKTRVIKTFTFTDESARRRANFDSNKPFNLYISGIDTYGSIKTVSRSDVNIVATVNPKTHDILLTTIPRDAYVRIALGGNDEYDKLTHAGIYGVESSLQTLENLLDIEITAYARVNFTSLIDLVDKVGGIEVNNPVAFTTDGGEHFPAGVIRMDGAKALTFSRERHNLVGGDTDRGKNQQRVIEALFRKIASPVILTKYQDVMAAVGKSVQTNLTSDQIAKLVRTQLNSSADWKFTSQTVTGRGERGLHSYAMPNSDLYMYVLDAKSLSQTKQQIQRTLTGS